MLRPLLAATRVASNQEAARGTIFAKSSAPNIMAAELFGQRDRKVEDARKLARTMASIQS